MHVLPTELLDIFFYDSMILTKKLDQVSDTFNWMKKNPSKHLTLIEQASWVLFYAKFLCKTSLVWWNGRNAELLDDPLGASVWVSQSDSTINAQNLIAGDNCNRRSQWSRKKAWYFPELLAYSAVMHSSTGFPGRNQIHTFISMTSFKSPWSLCHGSTCPWGSNHPILSACLNWPALIKVSDGSSIFFLQGLLLSMKIYHNEFLFIAEHLRVIFQVM